MSRYPTIEELHNKATSEVLLTVYRSYLSILSQIVYLGISLLIVIGLNVSFPDLSEYLRWLAIVPILFFLNILRTSYNEMTHFEVHKVTRYLGRLGLNYAVPSVKYTDVRAVTVIQDIFGRFFDYGDIELGTAGTDGYEMIVYGVRSPNELAILVEQLREASAKIQGLDLSAPPQNIMSGASNE